MTRNLTLESSAYGEEKQWLCQIMTLKLIRIIQTLSLLYTLFTCMFEHVVVNHYTYCFIFLATYKELRGEGWLLLSTSVMRRHNAEKKMMALCCPMEKVGNQFCQIMEFLQLWVSWGSHAIKVYSVSWKAQSTFSSPQERPDLLFMAWISRNRGRTHKVKERQTRSRYMANFLCFPR